MKENLNTMPCDVLRAKLSDKLANLFSSGSVGSTDATAMAAYWKKTAQNVRSKLVGKDRNQLVIGITGTQYQFCFFKDGTVQTVRLPRDRRPMHMEEPDANREVVGMVRGKIVYRT